MKYIDAHVHVWTDDFDRYPLSPPFQGKRYAPQNLLPRMNSSPTPNRQASIGLS